MSLLEKQWLFTECLGKLIAHTYSKGWKLSLGDGYRPDQKGHMKGSLHYSRLAQDLNLFVGGVWITKDHPAWHELGRFWLSLDPLCAWGGEFQSVDLNHFSVEHDGKR